MNDHFALPTGSKLSKLNLHELQSSSLQPDLICQAFVSCTSCFTYRAQPQPIQRKSQVSI